MDRQRETLRMKRVNEIKLHRDGSARQPVVPHCQDNANARDNGGGEGEGGRIIDAQSGRRCVFRVRSRDTLLPPSAVRPLARFIARFIVADRDASTRVNALFARVSSTSVSNFRTLRLRLAG